MGNDNKKKEALQKAAMEEFMEKGFTKASLRNICKNAGVTTGALYFFFEDKEDLFASLVEQPISQIIQLVQEHIDEEDDEMGLIEKTMGSHVHDLIEVDSLVDYMYDNFDALYLVLNRAEGTRFHGIQDQVISMCEEHGKRVMASYSEALHGEQINDALMHWLAHDIVGLFIYMVEHRIPIEDARNLVHQGSLYMFGGLMSIIKGIGKDLL